MQEKLNSKETTINILRKITIYISILLIASCTAQKELIENGEISNKENSFQTQNNSLENNNKNMKDTVEKGSNIAVSYTGTLKDGTVFDATSKHGGVPLEFTAGAGQMIPGFDAGVIGMKLGETKTINIPASEAYGEYDETRKKVIEKKELESFVNAGFKLEKGEKLPTQMGELEIIEATEENVTIDTNHALAGKDLIFEVKIEKIK